MAPRTLALTLVALMTLAPRPLAAQEIPADSPIAPLLRDARTAIDAIVAVPDAQRNFDNTVGAFDDLYTRLQMGLWPIEFMAHVSTNADERARGERAGLDASNFFTAVAKRDDLYRAVKTYAATNPKLEGEQKRLLEHALRDYRRAGMDLPADKRAELEKLELEQNQLSLDFDRNIREDDTRIPLTRDELRGLSEDVFKSLEKRRSGALFLVGLDYPTYNAIQETCEVEATRQKVYVMNRRKAGRNITVLEKLLVLRARQAQLLGYPTIADYMIETRMAKNAKTVWEFYDKLKPLVRRKAEADYKQLQDEKRAHTGNASAVLEPWDAGFYERRLLASKYQVNQAEVAEYFPMDRVTEGLFAITQKIYGLEYKEMTGQALSKGRPLWHEDVRLFEVWDKATGKLLGEFYLDLHPRDNKFSHAAQFGLIPHKVWSDGAKQTPLVALVCNFTKPTDDKPALMQHDEVNTYFHEFGHCLHSILTEARYAQFAGTSVSRDFVEAPSQMFEHWVWNADVLQTFAKHYKSGAAIPPALVERMVAARNITSGLFTIGQMWLGITDMSYHIVPDGKVDTTKVANELYEQVTLYKAAPNTHFQAGFGHLTGYHAGYYGYLWSQVYAEELFSPFKAQGLLNPEAGMKYRKGILAKGGTVDEFEMIRAYLGREPRLEPFLERLGLKE